MAKVILPLQSAEARGKVGGLIFNTWRGLATVKLKKTPSNPQTARQLLIRAYLSTCSRAWASLDTAERAGWNTYAADHPLTDWTGTPKRLTGFDWFCGLTTRLLDIGQAQVDTAPAEAGPASPVLGVITGGAGQLSCAYTALAGNDKRLDWWLYGPHSVGRLGTLVRASHRSYITGETASPFVIGSLGAGFYTVFLRTIDETTGLASTFVSGTGTAT